MNDRTKVLVKRIIAFAIFMAALLVAALLWEPAFELNDDGGIRSILSGNGAYGSTPDSHAVFVSFPLTILLKGLYSISKSIPWYGLWNLLIVLVAEACAIQVLINKERKRIIERVLLLVSFSICLIAFFIYAQWTIMAGILCGMGLLVTVTTDRVATPAIFYVMSFAERDTVLYMLSPFILLAIINRVFGEDVTIKKLKPKLIKAAATIAVVVIVVAAAKVVDSSFYRGKDWKEYNEFNVTRSHVYDLSDFNLADKNKYQKNLEKKIDKNLFDPIRHWEPVLDKNIDSKTMKTIEDEVKRVNKSKGTTDRTRNAYKSLIESPMVITMGLMLLGLLILVIVISIKVGKVAIIKNAIVVAASIAFNAAIIVYLCSVGRPADRVLAALFMAQFMFLIGLFMKNGKGIQSKAIRITSIVLLVLVCVGSIYIFNLRIEGNKKANKFIKSEQKMIDYVKNDKDTVFLLNIESTFNSTHNIFSETQDASNLIGNGGWLSKSPIKNAAIRKYGYDDTGEILYKKDSKYIVESWVNTDWLNNYLRNRFGKSTLKEVDRIKSNDREWRVLKVYK